MNTRDPYEGPSGAIAQMVDDGVFLMHHPCEYMVVERMYNMDARYWNSPTTEIRTTVVIHARGSFAWCTDQLEHMRRWNRKQGLMGDLWMMPRPKKPLLPMNQKLLLEFLSNSGMAGHGLKETPE